MSYQVAHLLSLRENPNTARAGMKWTNEEDIELMKQVEDGIDIDDIAKAHKRTNTGVKARIMSNALAMMESKNMTMEQVSVCVHISVEDLQEYKQKQETKKATSRNEKPKVESITNDDKYMKILVEIRNLLKVIADK